MATRLVGSSAELLAALKTAAAGDSVLLRPGTYSGIDIRNLSTSNVTIASADPGNRAVLTDLAVRDSSGLQFSGLDFYSGPGAKIYGFQILGSSNIVLDRLFVHGTLDGVTNDTTALIIRNSNGVTVSNSRFTELEHGLLHLDNTNLRITGNEFADLRTDGIRGGGSSQVLIADNLFHDFHPLDGDHPDAVQFWTTNTTKAVSDIAITGNVVLRGNGAPIQGIFIRDDVGGLPFQNVSISGNTIVGALYNGIGVDGITGLSITGNTVLGTTDQPSSFRLQALKDAVVTGNTVTSVVEVGTVDALRANNILARTVDASATVPLAAAATTALGIGTLSTIAGAVTALTARLGYVDMPELGTAKQSFAMIDVIGTAGADRLSVASVGTSHVKAGAGDDMITGGTGASHILEGGAGNDTYTIRSAADRVIEAAGGGTDTIVAYLNYVLPDNVETLRLAAAGFSGTGNAGDNRLIGSDGVDKLFGLDGNDLLQGMDGNDTLSGGNGDDDLRGDGGNDLLDAGAGNDALQGGVGNDRLLGGTGNDILEGGAGADVLNGGAGADVFRFRPGDVSLARDVIEDFQRGIDRVDLGAIDARAATSTNEAFTWIGSAGFHKVAGELHFRVENGNAVVEGDTNGDGLADFAIQFTGVPLLAATDFVL